MNEQKAIAVVGLGAVLPDAPDAASFWANIRAGRYSIRDVPPTRWNPEFYYDSNPGAEDKTYSKIGAWVNDFRFDPFQMGIAIPPRVLAVMDDAQKWAIAAAHQALSDYGYPQRSLNPERVAVILGNAMAGEFHYRTNLRIHLPEFLSALSGVPEFQNLPADVQQALLAGVRSGMRQRIPEITEDTMPGELSNIIAGRVANVFNLGGPNFVTDAACASSLAALQSAIDGLVSYKYDAVLTGGVDRNMGADSFVKFSKIGALSPDGSRPYAEGANGFVMGEGAAIFLLKRLEDAERDGDRIYAVVRGIGSSSDGKGKGITAPNPIGQQRAIERAWKDAGVSPASVGLIEGHGTSTRVGDVVEVNSLNAIFGGLGLKTGAVALGSVKSNIGHLKSAAGAAGMLKVVMALHEKVLPPSINFHKPNPALDFAHLPFMVNTTLRAWEAREGEVRRAGLSSFGFGGTNFHVVMEEYVPGLGKAEARPYSGVSLKQMAAVEATAERKPYRGVLFAGAESCAALKTQLNQALQLAQSGNLPESRIPASDQLGQTERLAIDYSSADELVKRAEKALKALENETPAGWQALTAQGVFRGGGRPGKVAFLFPGQGSQYVNMLKDLVEVEPAAAETVNEADEVMKPILGRKLTDYIYVDGDEESLKRAEADLKNTAITQPAVLTANVALLRVLARFDIQPDMVIGHSLGEYAALVAAGVLTFSEALEVVSARGREMTRVAMSDNGCMAAVSAPLAEVERILKTIPGYVVLANINSPLQSVIGGETAAVDAALAAFQTAGFQAVKIPVSHAFHTKIVGPASEPLKQVIRRMQVKAPKLPVVSNVTGELYPGEPEAVIDLLGQQVASPVQFIRGVETLYAQGARVFVEVGPKRVLSALTSDILKERDDVTILATNHPRKGALVSLNEALCGLFAAGIGAQKETHAAPVELYSRSDQPAQIEEQKPGVAQTAAVIGVRNGISGSVVISGAGLGLPGKGRRVFDDNNVRQILRGESRIDALDDEKRRTMVEKRITRLVKSEAGAVMEMIDDLSQTVKLAGQAGEFDLERDFGINGDRVEATDIATQLAMAAGVEALRDAGIPLVMRYKPTSTGSFLPTRWMLPESLADETGVVFGSAFPGLERMADEAERYYRHERVLGQLNELRALRKAMTGLDESAAKLLDERIAELNDELREQDYHFDRRFIFRVLAMGHSQFAEYIGARGPNTSVNAACATTTHALAIAEDWIRAGRCRRVVIIAGDDVTDGRLVSWIGSGLLASGAATTEADLRKAAIPFDRRRNGMIMGMGAAALVVESEDAVRERGMRGIAEVLATQIGNSAFHGTRLDVNHVSEVMDRLVAQAESRFGIRREAMAGEMVFVSHETYTPARGGSAAAEIHALRRTFGEQANRVVIANTKGFTGHTMGVGIEDVVAVKALEYQEVPPIAHLDDEFEPDPELGDLNLSRGGHYPVQYALRLGAGFGSQIAMSLLRKINSTRERVDRTVYDRWLASVSGYPRADLEIEKRTLRICDAGVPVTTPAASTWRFGEGPTLWAENQREDAGVDQNVEPQPAAEPVAAVPDADAVRAFVMGLVSEKTGYPVEMLDPGLDLEADLGIDTVKQAELFAAVREHYGIPRREDLRLVDYNTLEKVVRFVMESVGTMAVSTPAKTAEPVEVTTLQAAAPLSPAVVNADAVRAFVMGLVSEKTGYPVEMLDPGLDLEADLGIDTVKQAELFAAVREHYGIPRREDLRLVDYNTLEKVVRFVLESVDVDAKSSPAPTIEIAQPVVQNSDEPESEAAGAGIDDADAVRAFVMGLVSEKTGYPVEMLDPGLDLEADLGIDTVKQAELFAAVREHYGIPRREDLRLVDYNTLEKVVGFVLDATAAQTGASDPAVEAKTDEIAKEFEGSGSMKRSIVQPVLRPRSELCLSTGVELTAGQVVLVVGNPDGLGEALARKLRARKVKVERLNANAAVERVMALKDTLTGLFFLNGARRTEWPNRIETDAWEDGVYSLAKIARAMAERAFVVSAVRLDGTLGYSTGASDPSGGLISGFCKALKRERPDCLVKVVDLGDESSASQAADWLLEETMSDPAVVEVGRSAAMRFTPLMIERTLPNAAAAAPLAEGSVFVITGGTAGIVAPIALELARATRGRFYLLGRTALPDAEDPNLHLLRSDRAALMQMTARRLTDDGKKATPAEVEKALSALERGAAVLALMDELRSLGGDAVYLNCDVTSAEQTSSALKRIVEQAGRIDCLIHAAGIERSRKLESKPDEEIRTIVSAKAMGLVNLLKGLNDLSIQPGRMVLFSSVAGRFGNAGQTDYSAANDFLCKAAAALNAQLPEMQTLVVDWGAWAEVGMASRGHMPALMKRAGIEMMDPQEAARALRNEIERGTRGEVILSGALGALSAELEVVNGGLDVQKANDALLSGKPVHKMLSRLKGMSIAEGIVLEAELDPEREVFLKDHALNGIPILPGVMGIEGFTVAARHVASTLGSAGEGFDVIRLEDIQFLVPFKFYRGEPRRITWKAQVLKTATGLEANVTLESTVARFGRGEEILRHFSGRVLLEARQSGNAEAYATPPCWNGHPTVNAEDIYRLYFHGPAFQVLAGVQRCGEGVVGLLNKSIPAMDESGEGALNRPMLVELCLQTAGVWEAGRTGVLALPQSIGELVFHGGRVNGAAVFADVKARQDYNGKLHFDARVVDEKGRVFVELKDYQTSPLPYGTEPQLLEPLRILVQEE